MVYNPSLGNLTDFRSKIFSTRNPLSEVIFGRVVEVITSKDDPSPELFSKYGELDSINGIVYKNLFDSSQEDELEALPFAYCDNSNFLKVPVKGEIVAILSKPTGTSGGGDYPFVQYYTSIVNLWKNPHHNGLPDTKSEVTELNLGSNVVEQPQITGLQPFTGDLIIEGRLGQSIRLGGYKHPSNILTDDLNNGKPFAIFKVGQDPTYNSLDKYIEDINKDLSSLYLTSDHIVPLTTSTNKQDTFLKDDTPTKFTDYKGNQAILDSGRLILHSRKDSLFLNSIKSISFSSDSINLDSVSYAAIDSKEIFLGAEATQPAILGDSNEDLLRTLFKLLSKIANGFTAIKDPASAVTILAGLSEVMKGDITTLESKLPNLLSKKIKVE